ncbi:kininogen-1 [Periophthalmus magnuspinnatus]|uniref:kininogen-1 n=1 Tax=Periophthalmus magnuspinnatus TaxID=409849 RepID=UPI002436BCEA|nr:kininogen-1 [Periophthalmus magnuspinnatus]
MGRALGLCALALLSLQNTLVLSGEVLIFCDDPTVDKAVTSAINKFNEGMHTGHKLALFQVMSASKTENGSYWLKFTTRRSSCSASDATPWTDCEYLPIDKKPIKCNATVHMNETDTDTEHVECQIEGLSHSGKAQCLGCPEEIDQNSEDLKVPLSVSISKYNSQSDHTHLFTLNDVGPATRQVVAGFRFKFKFDMRRTKCAKEEHKDLQEHCTADPDNVELANCNSTVDMAPWRQELPNVQLECGSGAMPPMILRRRPPGWSPLRNILIQFPTASPKAPPPSDAPPKTKEAKISGKEESSEEDLAKPSASPEDSLFHCPSKPWKPFHPHARSSAAEATPTNAPVEGAFSDTDLLG